MVWLRRKMILWFLRVLKQVTQGQGFVLIDVGYDSAIDVESCRVTCYRERDGEKFDHRFYDLRNAAVVIDDLSRNRIKAKAATRPLRHRRQQQGGEEE